MSAEDLNLPWSAEGAGDIVDSTGTIIIDVFLDSLEDDERVAEFIVRACNSHYELVNALERTGVQCGSREGCSTGCGCLTCEVVKALAKAKGTK